MRPLVVAVECAVATIDLLLHIDGHGTRGHRRRRHRPGRARRRVHGPGAQRGRAERSSRASTSAAAPDDQIATAARPGRGGPGRDRRSRADRRSCRSVCARRPTIRAGPRSPSAAWPARTARSSARPASARASSVASDLDGVAGDDGTDVGQLLHARLRRGSPATRNFRPRVGRPISPVADPQVLDLVGPVRLDRLRRLRPVHHVVPGRHRRSRGAARDRAPDAAPAPIPWPPSPAAGHAPAPLPDRRAGPPRRRPTSPAPSRETARHRDAPLSHGRPRPPRQPARPVRDGRPPGPGRPADLDLADPARRPRPHDPARRPGDRRADRLCTPGARLSLRGPLGRPWPIETASGGDVVIVAGGIGLAPLRPVIDAVLARAPPLRRRPPLPRRPDAARPAVRRRDGRPRRADRPRDRGDRRPRRAGLARPGRRGHPALRPSAMDRRADDGLRLRPGPDDAGDGARPLPACGVAAERTWLTLERNMACGVGPVRPLPAGAVLRLPRRPGLLRGRARRHVHGGGPLMLAVVQPPARPLARSTADRRRQVRVVRRLPADAPRPRGRAARDRRTGRHRRVRRGDLEAVVRARSTSCSSRARSARRSRPSRDRPPARRDDDPRDDRRLRDVRRDPGAAQLGGPRRGALRSCIRSRRTSSRSRQPRPSPTTSPSTPSCAAARSRPTSCASSSPRSWPGRRPKLPDEAVCAECKRRGIVCVAVAEGVTCLGPVTRSGCGALCPAYRARLLRLLRAARSRPTATGLATWLGSRSARRPTSPAASRCSTPGRRRSGA